MPSLPPHKKNRILAAALLANGICKTMHEQNRASRALLLDFYLKERAKEKHHYRKSKAAKNRRRRQRKSWKQFQASLNNRQFRRTFRMSRACFQHLCDRIEQNVGDTKLKGEEFLSRMKEGRIGHEKLRKMNRAHEKDTGGFISGEIKLALTLRMLAGGSYLDLSLLYEVGCTYAYDIFHDVIANWICDDRLVHINCAEYLNNEERMRNVAREFAVGSGGILAGCIGALDGWLVKILKPNKDKDGVDNVGGYWSRKGFFAVNVQVIVDKKKMVLFRSIKCRGAEHDSTAFKASSLYDVLISKANWLMNNGLYFIGDSAYALRSFILTPYDNANHASSEDDFNFHHSSARIYVECAFGEIDQRWGIFWKPLKFSLKHNVAVIDAALRLHNFIVDFREKYEKESATFEQSLFDDDCLWFLTANPEMIVGVFGGEEERRFDNIGRPTNADAHAKSMGKVWRDKLRDAMQAKGLIRPMANWFRNNVTNRIAIR